MVLIKVKKVKYVSRGKLIYIFSLPKVVLYLCEANVFFKILCNLFLYYDENKDKKYQQTHCTTRKFGFDDIQRGSLSDI